MSGVALFIAMLISAIIPGPSVMAVISRSISSGSRHGLVLALGILFADYIFICFALLGLSTASSLLGDFAVFIKYFGASYLFWLAFRIWRADIALTEQAISKSGSLLSTTLVGLIIGLANPKAILFYMGFFPAFVDLTRIGLHDVAIILLISTTAVGGVLCFYAFVAAKASYLFKGDKARRMLNRLSSSILASCGVLLVTQT